MTNKGSAAQTGGLGTNFEQIVQTAFLTTLIIRGNVPCLSSSQITEIAFQTNNREYATDDLLVIAKSQSGSHRLLIECKNNISFTVNDKFKKVIKAFWEDYNNPEIFDKAKDKLLIIKSGLTNDERNHVKTLFNWARSKATANDFILQINTINVKKKKLEIFREVLKEANNNIALTEQALWEVLKCIDVLEYDFLNDGSVHRTFFLNLIKLCKSSNSNLNEKEIWDSMLAYVSKLNPQGGSITLEKIENEDFYRHFDNAKLHPYSKAVDKLYSDSQLILRLLTNKIGKGENKLHFPKLNEREKITEAILNNQITIVTGRPGVGKSSIIKEVLVKSLTNASTFVFRADQFSEPTIANTLSKQGINKPIKDIFSCIALIPEKIIFIDSLEKLLEAEKECAFEQLLELVKENNIKLVTSCRKYAIDLIKFRFQIDEDNLDIIEIPLLNEDELNLASGKFPQINSFLKNKDIKNILQVPKYLDFAIRAIDDTNKDYSEISVRDFKDMLWNELVVDCSHTISGLPLKREEAFKEIAVKRAREMKLFTNTAGLDSEAVMLLEKDDIIFKGSNNRYAPSHDILEDWALVKYVEDKVEEYNEPNELFLNLGNEPAIRRAFRLWVEDNLDDDSGKIYELVRASLKQKINERYWSDEILIAILKSDNSSSFFKSFEKELLENMATLLLRCIHLLRTCCKETNTFEKGFSQVIPIGSGWESIVIFTAKHLINLNHFRSFIIKLIVDWQNRITLKKYSPKIDELYSAKKIVLHFLQKFEPSDINKRIYSVNFDHRELIQVLYNLASVSKQEIKSLITRALADLEDKDNSNFKMFYEYVIDMCLSGSDNHNLIKELPELVVETATKYWKFEKKDVKLKIETEYIIKDKQSVLHDLECWGFDNRNNFYPSNIYKTPLYSLLKFHPKTGLKFLVQILNYSIDFYLNADCDINYELIQLELELNDGPKVKQWGNPLLWAAYRDGSMTNYLIGSLLMSLEKYLLETAAHSTSSSRNELKFAFNFLLQYSNNVATTAVLTSVSIAYPEEVEDEMLPLLSCREFYEWDRNRSTGFTPNAIKDDKFPLAQQERMESNQLPHRKKYFRGLQDFIIDYQLRIKKLNNAIHKIFDKLHDSNDGNDIYLTKTLTEIDIRKWGFHVLDKEKGESIISPDYGEDVQAIINSEDKKETTKALKYKFTVEDAYKQVEALSIKLWEEIYIYFLKKESRDTGINDRVSLALIGLRDLKNKLKSEQKLWCIETLKNTIDKILIDVYGTKEVIIDYPVSEMLDPFEKEIALKSFHYLFSNSKNQEETNQIILSLCKILVAPYNDDIRISLKYIRSTLFGQFPKESKRVWYFLVKYSEFEKTNHENIEERKQKEEAFFKEYLTTKDISIDIEKLDFKTHEAYYLASAFTIITYENEDPLLLNFIERFCNLFFEHLAFKETDTRNATRNEDKFEYEGMSLVEDQIPSLLIHTNRTLSKTIIDLMLKPLETEELYRKEFCRVSSNIIEHTLYRLDHILEYSNNTTLNKKLIDDFWFIWKYIFEKIKNNSQHYSASDSHIYMFGWRYVEEADIKKMFYHQIAKTLLFDVKLIKLIYHLSRFEGQKEFYYQMVRTIGTSKASSIINFFSTTGEQTFLPEGILLLVEILKESNYGFLSPSAERMIERLYYNHITKIKSNKKLIEDYLWILNKMVDSGSSQAYLIREQVITYKNV